MTAYTDFQNSIASAASLTAMYTELRRLRKLPPRGQLPPGNEDLLWLPRSAIVASLSSLDAYVHAVLYEQIPHILQGNQIPDELCESMIDVIPIRNASSFRDALPIILTTSTHLELSTRLREKTLSFRTYQAPDKILLAYRMIGHVSIFADVSAIWPGPQRSEADIKRLLSNYTKRRNQIAHEGDRLADGRVRHIQPNYANGCADFIGNLVTKLNQVVYGP